MGRLIQQSPPAQLDWLRAVCRAQAAAFSENEGQALAA